MISERERIQSAYRRGEPAKSLSKNKNLELARNETEDRGSLERSGLAARLTKLEGEREAERQLAQPIGLKRALKIQRFKGEGNEMCVFERNSGDSEDLQQ